MDSVSKYLMTSRMDYLWNSDNVATFRKEKISCVITWEQARHLSFAGKHPWVICFTSSQCLAAVRLYYTWLVLLKKQKRKQSSVNLQMEAAHVTKQAKCHVLFWKVSPCAWSTQLTTRLLIHINQTVLWNTLVNNRNISQHNSKKIAVSIKCQTNLSSQKANKIRTFSWRCTGLHYCNWLYFVHLLRICYQSLEWFFSLWPTVKQIRLMCASGFTGLCLWWDNI